MTRINSPGSSSSISFPTDGWTSAIGTWAYATASTITVPSGAASLYQKGDKIKFTQNSTVKYFYITAVADTTLTVTAGNDYVVEDTATYPITLNYYSHVANPLGFPQWFDTAAPTFNVATYDNGSGGQPTTNRTRFKIVENMCVVHYFGTGVKAGTDNTIQFDHSIYATALNVDGSNLVGHGAYHTSAWGLGFLTYANSSTTIFYSAANINDNTALDALTFVLTFEI